MGSELFKSNGFFHPMVKN